MQPPAPVGNWQVVGLQGVHISSVAISPNFGADATLFAGSDGSGLFRSTDGADSWEQAAPAFANTIVPAVAFSPAFDGDSTAFAGMLAGVGAGLLRTVDAGDTWQQLTTGAVQAIAVSPSFASDSTVFADFGDGIYRSTDRGVSWEKMSAGVALSPPAGFPPPPAGQTFSMAMSPEYQADATIFAGIFGGGPFRSTDGGATWEQVRQGMIYAWVLSLAVTPTFGFDSTQCLRERPTASSGHWTAGIRGRIKG